ncbi:unnamed protein product [Didymodactylos carnosus]|uniref:Uncharacterized protein n=1 Tax=Didymodactylos carnosus TaxID=1234261 RepID=A0A815UK04_9BILA|nr:unnamed protein product [Didymodactylos carnosus]CAF1518653.1 unnamed protein product [Didymodactylos carnosus]CAF4295715.1 unnamed protein product [Didymodactylos carnosus]CAF4378348.1 unnamed protein product [Didymodactylos carnosus]
MEDNPPDGGTIHRKRKKSTQRDDERRSKSRATNNPQRQQHPQLTKPPAQLAPLILQGVKNTRFQLSKLITKNMPDVKLTNIQSNKNNTFTSTTVKLTFADSFNRDTIVRTGLHLQHLNIIAEPAKCAEAHNSKDCDKNANQIKCKSCEGKHYATSHECDKYKEQEKRLKSTIENYSSTSSTRTRPSPTPNINDYRAFPSVGGPRHQNSSATSTVDIVEAVFKKVIAILQPTLAKILEKLELTTTTASPASTTGTTTHQNHMDLDNFATEEDPDQIDLDDNEDGKSIEIEETQVINNNDDRETFYEVMNQNLSTTKRLVATTTGTNSVEKSLYSFQPKHKTTQEKQ